MAGEAARQAGRTPVQRRMPPHVYQPRDYPEQEPIPEQITGGKTRIEARMMAAPPPGVPRLPGPGREGAFVVSWEPGC